MTPATAITDAAWVRARIGGAAKLYGCASPQVLGTVWWYSLSSVLIGPVVEALVRDGVALDPALDAVELDMLPDGRFRGAHATRALPGDLEAVGKAMAEAYEPVIATISQVSGARVPALRAIATDSVGNRLLWTVDPERAMTLAEPLVAAIGHGWPKPRFVRVGRAPVVRRASCCLIYETANASKCTSCPRQRPEERERRLRTGS
ncbi:(2Fe-2S)-binding protein [Amycolatopsis sp. NPDC059657]|uniref:(2Fe-2S)-binding protein n=1 Tax=Amycolatopsis sp. NPDC059657 TaxID=3346899 RepID=UPI00366B60E6